MGPNAATGQVGNWKFVDASKTYNPLSASQSGQDYTALLMGEIDGDWMPPGALAPAGKAEARQSQAALFTNESSSPADSEIPAFVSERQGVLSKSDKPKESTGVQLFLPVNASAQKDGVVLIPVWLNNESNKQISSFSFGVRFDPSVLQPEQRAFETDNTLIGNGFMVVSDQATAGRLGIAATSSNNSAAFSGTLVYLRFKVVGTKSDADRLAMSTLTFETDSQTVGTFEDNFGNEVPSGGADGSFSRLDSKQYRDCNNLTDASNQGRG